MNDAKDSKKIQKEDEVELNDLLISSTDESEFKSSQGKKVMLMGATAIILFAVIVFIVYLFQDDEPQKQANMPKQSLERVSKPTSNIPSQPQFEQLPIAKKAENSDEQFERIINQIKEQQRQQQALPSAPIEPPKQAIQESPKQQPTQSKAPSQPKEQPKQPPKEKVAQTPKPSPKDSAKNPPPQDIQKGFYIQVGSFSKLAPNQKILDAIKSNNYSHQMQKVGDVNRLFIGPFSSRADAQAKLAEVKEKINRDAFIKEIK